MNYLRTLRQVATWVGVTVVFWAAGVAWCGDAVPSADEVIDRIGAQEQLLKNIRITAKHSYERKSAGEDAWKPGGHGSVTATLMGGLGSPYRFEGDVLTTWTRGAAPFSRRIFVEAYNGRVTQTLYLHHGIPEIDEKQPHGPRGQIEARKEFPIEYGPIAWQYSIYGAGGYAQRLSEHLRLLQGRSGNTMEVKQVEEDGLPCLKLILRWEDGRMSAWTFDPEHGYALRREEVFSKDGKTTRLCVAKAIKEIAPGVYYPWESVGTSAVMGRDGPFENRLRVEVIDAKANMEDLDKKVFEIQWPKGTYVEDTISGSTFVVGEDGAASQ